MMQPKIAYYAAYLLVNLGGSLLITVAHYVVLFEAWRRGLTTFLRWLMPSTLASTTYLVAQILGAVAPNLGISPYLILLCRCGLNVAGLALAVVAVFQLWRMIREWPVGAGAGAETPQGEQAAGQQPGGPVAARWSSMTGVPCPAQAVPPRDRQSTRFICAVYPCKTLAVLFMAWSSRHGPYTTTPQLNVRA